MSILNPNMMSFLSSLVRGPFSGDPGLHLPSAGLIFKAMTPDLVDSIGLSISSYVLLDPYWQAFFFDDPTTPKTDVTWADVAADPSTNTPGGQVYYSATRNIVAIYSTSPVEAQERRLWRYMFGSAFDIMTDNGVVMTDNGYQLYEVANA